jgi:hypothetical protein
MSSAGCCRTQPRPSPTLVLTDITQIATGGGYTQMTDGAGGILATFSALAQATAAVNVATTGNVFTATGAVGTFRYVILVDDTPTSPAQPGAGLARSRYGHHHGEHRHVHDPVRQHSRDWVTEDTMARPKAKTPNFDAQLREVTASALRSRTSCTRRRTSSAGLDRQQEAEKYAQLLAAGE